MVDQPLGWPVNGSWMYAVEGHHDPRRPFVDEELNRFWHFVWQMVSQVAHRLHRKNATLAEAQRHSVAALALRSRHGSVIVTPSRPAGVSAWGAAPTGRNLGRFVLHANGLFLRPLSPAAVAASPGDAEARRMAIRGRLVESHAACPACGAERGRRRCECGWVRYCDEACQRAHWRQHRPFCTEARGVG